MGRMQLQKDMGSLTVIVFDHCRKRLTCTPGHQMIVYKENQDGRKYCVQIASCDVHDQTLVRTCPQGYTLGWKKPGGKLAMGGFEG